MSDKSNKNSNGDELIGGQSKPQKGDKLIKEGGYQPQNKIKAKPVPPQGGTAVVSKDDKK